MPNSFRLLFIKAFFGFFRMIYISKKTSLIQHFCRRLAIFALAALLFFSPGSKLASWLERRTLTKI